MTTTVDLPLQRLAVDQTLHARSSVSTRAIRRLQEAAASGEELPPVVAFQQSPDEPCWLADGFLRFYAARRDGRETIPVEIRPGGQREAYVHACGANAEHGLPRTRDDRWRSVVAAMHVRELAERDDTWLARNCCVSRTLVRQVRQDCQDEETLAQAFVRRAQRSCRKPRPQGPSSVAPPAGETALSETEVPDPAESLIARAYRAVRRAGQALAAAERAYPEVVRPEASLALMEARNLLEDQLAPEDRSRLGLVSSPELSQARRVQQEMLALWPDAVADSSARGEPATKRAEQPRTKRAEQPRTKRAEPPPFPPSCSLPPVGRAGEGVSRRATSTLGGGGFNFEPTAAPDEGQPPTKRAEQPRIKRAEPPPFPPSCSLPPAGRAGEGVNRLGNLHPGSTNLEQSAR